MNGCWAGGGGVGRCAGKNVQREPVRVAEMHEIPLAADPSSPYPAGVRPYNTAESSSTNRRFGRAPTSFNTGSPPRKTMNVGIDSTP